MEEEGEEDLEEVVDPARPAPAASLHKTCGQGKKNQVHLLTHPLAPTHSFINVLAEWLTARWCIASAPPLTERCRCNAPHDSLFDRFLCVPLWQT
jgi:hypothetical protein